MANFRSFNTPSPMAAALTLLFAASAWGQTEAQRLERVTVTARAAPVLDAGHADVGGVGNTLGQTPQSISVLGCLLYTSRCV